MNQLQLILLVNLFVISLPLVSAQTKTNLSPATVTVEEKNDKVREGTPHPLLLGWIVLDQQHKQTVLNEEQFPQETKMLKKQAQQRGLSMLFPILDIEDMTTLTHSEVIKGTKMPVMKIAERYGVEAILVGWLLAKEEWQGQWRLYWKDQEIPVKNKHKNINNLLVEGLDATLDARASQSLPVKTATPVKTTVPIKTFEIKVTDVTTFEDYTRVAQYLQNLTIIKKLQVSQLQLKQVTFRISVAGGRAAFTKIIRLDSLLTPHRRKGKTTYRLIKNAKV